MTLTERVAEFTAGLDSADVPSDVVEKAKVTLLHDLGVGLAGHRLAETGYAFAKEHGGCDPARGARLLIDGTPVTVEAFALATGALVHARTQDDTQIAGYEAASAIAERHAARSTARGFRASSVYGPFAAAAASARLLGLSAGQTASALGLAAAFGGGTNQTWVAGTQEWRYQVGAASRNGMVAALLAARGATGAPDALDGTAGHFRAFAGAGPGEELPEMGGEWRIRRVTYKPFPVCAINQIPVTVLIGMDGVRPDDVEAITVELPPDDAAYPGIDAHGPFRDVGGTLMSLPYCLAVALRKGGIDLDDLYGFDDSALLDLARRITVAADERLPGGCRITVKTRANGTLTSEFVPDASTFNWGRAEAADRLRAMSADLPLPAGRLERFIAVVLDLDRRPVRELVDATIADPKE